jgi:hypothetical protein
MALDTERDELLRIAQRDGGKLLPGRVVEEARDPASPLHTHFEWDDTEAAHEYRKAQARSLIARCRVTVLMPEPVVVRAFLSVPDDRRAGGYTPFEDVNGDEHMRAQMLDDMLRRVAYWRQQARLFAAPAVLSALEGLEVAAVRERDKPTSGGKKQRKDS